MGPWLTLNFYLHLLAAATWIGPQVMMFAVVVPSLRALPEESLRLRLLRVLAPRLGWLGIGSLVLLFVTGTFNIIYLTPAQPFSYWYGYMLTLKVALVIVIATLALVHSFRIGPAQLALQETALAGDADPATLRAARLRSVLVSALTLLLSLLVLLIAASFRSEFAYRRA